MVFASSTSLFLSLSTPNEAFSEATFFILSMAQKRFTAVGLVEAMREVILSNSFEKPFMSVALDLSAPRATPMAAATPMAGAPRTIMSLIALATSV